MALAQWQAGSCLEARGWGSTSDSTTGCADRSRSSMRSSHSPGAARAHVRGSVGPLDHGGAPRSCDGPTTRRWPGTGTRHSVTCGRIFSHAGARAGGPWPSSCTAAGVARDELARSPRARFGAAGAGQRSLRGRDQRAGGGPSRRPGGDGSRDAAGAVGRGQCRGDAMHSSNPPQWRPAPAVTAALSLARRAPRLPMPAGRRPAWRYAPSVDNPPMRHGGVR